ncbi:MAG: helix-turn-helix transcriptional regulator [Erysipelotrichaceae bacterium]
MTVFSEKVMYLMEEQGLTQKELSKRANVTESAISYYLSGDRTPRSDVLVRIAKALGTSIDFLLGSEENISNDLQYLQRNLRKLDPEKLKKAEDVLKAVFDDIFDDEG